MHYRIANTLALVRCREVLNNVTNTRRKGVEEIGTVPPTKGFRGVTLKSMEGEMEE